MSANHKPCEFAYWILAFSIYPKMLTSFIKDCLNVIPCFSIYDRSAAVSHERLERLYEELGYARYLMYATQGIDYSKPNVQHSTPQFDKITIDLDRIDRIEKKIAYYESFNVLWEKWQKKMTPRETDVCHKRYMQDKAIVDISSELQVSNVRIYGLIGQLEAKYEEFTKENSQYL